jgi:hypothetical protein
MVFLLEQTANAVRHADGLSPFLDICSAGRSSMTVAELHISGRKKTMQKTRLQRNYDRLLRHPHGTI